MYTPSIAHAHFIRVIREMIIVGDVSSFDDKVWLLVVAPSQSQQKNGCECCFHFPSVFLADLSLITSIQASLACFMLTSAPITQMTAIGRSTQITTSSIMLFSFPLRRLHGFQCADFIGGDFESSMREYYCCFTLYRGISISLRIWLKAAIRLNKFITCLRSFFQRIVAGGLKRLAQLGDFCLSLFGP